jgi:hypothetical protein
MWIPYEPDANPLENLSELEHALRHAASVELDPERLSEYDALLNEVRSHAKDLRASSSLQR